MSELARLRWKCRRGMLELDLLLGAFVEHGYQRLEPTQRSQFERLLDYPDTVLLEWLLGRIQPTEREIVQLVDKIRASAAT